MVVLNKIYTRTGDDGRAALGTGERRLKSDARFVAIGAIDELNAHVGLARLEAEGDLDADPGAHPERSLRLRRRSVRAARRGAPARAPADRRRTRRPPRRRDRSPQRRAGAAYLLRPSRRQPPRRGAASLPDGRPPRRRAAGRSSTRRSASIPKRSATSTGSPTSSSSPPASPIVAGAGDVLWVPGENR